MKYFMSLKALANEDTLLPTQMFPRFPAHAAFVADTKLFLIFFRNILCPQQVLVSQQLVIFGGFCLACVFSLKLSLQFAASNRIKGTSHKNLNKNTSRIPCLDWNNCKKCRMDWVKNDVCPPSHAPNCASRQFYFLALILSRHSKIS